MSPKSPSHLSAAKRAEPTEAGARCKPAKLEPGLYILATPIGNLRDVSLRVLDALAAADVVACEDTRVTRKLLAAHGLRRRLATYHEHNAERARPALIEHLKSGKSVALVSDAGTPLVSDPGYKLVQAAVAAGLPVTALPGPSAPLAALVLSGLPSDRFLFAGYLPPRRAGRRKAIAELAAVPATLIFLESARRVPAALEDLAAGLGPRPAALARELTKLYEEVCRDDLPDLAARFARDGPPRGETVIVVGPPPAAAVRPDDLDARLTAALGSASLRDAAAAVAAATGLPRQKVYARALQLKERDRGGA